MGKKIEELCLLLMFLTGWEEESRQKPGEKIFQAWKGHLFETLNKLAVHCPSPLCPSAAEIVGQVDELRFWCYIINTM